MDSKPVTVFDHTHPSYSHPVLTDGPPCFDEHDDIEERRVPKERNIQQIKNFSQKFESLVEKSSRVLFRAKTVFPFDFFPDSVIIDENKVNIIHGMFFLSDEVQSILIHHIKDVIVDSAVFFATLKILPDGYGENWVDVSYLWKNDATRARRIISGLLVGFKEGIDITQVETTNLEKKIEALGAVS